VHGASSENGAAHPAQSRAPKAARPPPFDVLPAAQGEEEDAAQLADEVGINYTYLTKVENEALGFSMISEKTLRKRRAGLSCGVR